MIRSSALPGASRLPAAILVSVLLSSTLGCAGSRQGPVPPSPERIPELERAVQEEPADVDALTRLGAAYREAGRQAEAREVLERARERSPGHPPAVFFLGLTLEDLERYDEAREMYSTYLASGDDPPLAGAVADRLRLLQRRELEASVRRALDREGEYADRRPPAATVAVFPFLYRGTDEGLRPLGRALAEFLTTDLARTERLRVVERMRVQLLLDEMALADSGYVNPGTAVRSGRILGAGRLVQGLLAGDAGSLEAEASVVEVDGDPAGAGPTVAATGAAERLFELEARLALGIYQDLGIELTPAERDRVTRRPTGSLEALLAFGRGLVAEDSAHFGRAARQYRQAAELDPGFSAAVDRAELVEGISSALELDAAALSSLALSEFYGPGPGPGVFDAGRAVREPGFLAPTPWTRDAVMEVLGFEGLTGRPVEFRIIVGAGGSVPP